MHEVGTSMKFQSQCQNIQAVADSSICVVTLWDNAAVYTKLSEGDRIKLRDVKLTSRDGQPNLTARFCDQVEVSNIQFRLKYLLDNKL